MVSCLTLVGFPARDFRTLMQPSLRLELRTLTLKNQKRKIIIYLPSSQSVLNNPHTTQQSKLIYFRKNNIDFEFDAISGEFSNEIK